MLPMVANIERTEDEEGEEEQGEKEGRKLLL